MKLILNIKNIYKYCAVAILLTNLLAACNSSGTGAPLPSSPTEDVFANIKENLPVFPNAVESKDKPASYHYTIENASIDDVQRFYKDQMQTAGWKLLGIGDVGGGDIGKAYALWFANDQNTASVNIFIKENVTHVIVTVE